MIIMILSITDEAIWSKMSENYWRKLAVVCQFLKLREGVTFAAMMFKQRKNLNIVLLCIYINNPRLSKFNDGN